MRSRSSCYFRALLIGSSQKFEDARYEIPFFIHMNRNVNIGPREQAIQLTGGVTRYP